MKIGPKKIYRNLAIALGMALVGGVALSLFFPANYYKPKIEAAVAEATGVSLKINGDLSWKIFPRAGITMRDIHFSCRGTEILAAKELAVSLHLLPFLLHGEATGAVISISSPRVHIERSADGRFSCFAPGSGLAPLQSPLIPEKQRI